MIVADTNVIAYLLLPGPRTDSARAARDLDDQWRVPPWWRAEFLNVLASTVRRGLFGVKEAREAWDTAVEMLDGDEVEQDEREVLLVALRDRVSAYDAWFVALADALDVPLVTADRRLVAARPDRAILLEDFAAGSPRGPDAP